MTKRKLRAPVPGQTPAEIVREYGPFQAGETVHGVTYDGRNVWFATGSKLRALSPADGQLVGELELPCDAGTAFDGEYFYQLTQGRIHKVDPHTGRVLRSLPSPGQGPDAGLTWAEGKLWVAKYRSREIHQVDPESGEVLRTLTSDRYVTGVTWLDGELWHATLEDDRSELRRISPETGGVLERLTMPEGEHITGLESDGADLCFCGGGASGKLRSVRRPR